MTNGEALGPNAESSGLKPSLVIMHSKVQDEHILIAHLENFLGLYACTSNRRILVNNKRNIKMTLIDKKNRISNNREVAGRQSSLSTTIKASLYVVNWKARYIALAYTSSDVLQLAMNQTDHFFTIDH